MLFFLGVLLALSVLILVHEWGHFFAARRFGVRVDAFGFGFPPRLFAKKVGDTTYALNALPLGGYVKLFGEHDIPHGTSADLIAQTFTAQKIWKRIVIVSAGIVMNIVLGWLLLSLIFMFGMRQGVLVTHVVPNAPGEIAGVLSNDIILGYTSSDEFIATLREFQGESLVLRVERRGVEQEISIIPHIEARENEERIGVGVTDFGFAREPFFKALWSGARMTVWIIMMIGVTLYEVLVGVFGPGKVPVDVSGPVGIFQAAYSAGSLGWAYVLQLIGVISINLAILNLLPIPGLDGGRLLFLIIEKIRGKRIRPEREAMTHGIGVAALIILIVIVTFRDLSRLF